MTIYKNSKTADKLNVTLTNKQNGITLKSFDYFGSSYVPTK